MGVGLTILNGEYHLQLLGWIQLKEVIAFELLSLRKLCKRMEDSRWGLMPELRVQRIKRVESNPMKIVLAKMSNFKKVKSESKDGGCEEAADISNISNICGVKRQ